MEYFSTQNVLRFADYLFTNGDYLRSAGEYRRYLFYAGRSVGPDSIYYKMIKAVFLGRDYDQCRRLLDRFGETYPLSSINADVGLFRSIIHFRQRDYAGSLRLAQSPGVPASELKRIVVAMDYIHLGDFDKAKEWSCGPAKEHGALFPDGGTTIDRLCEHVERADELPRKSKVGAAVLSGVVPGAGKVYCGRVADGLYSLLVVGLTAWQSYDGFDDDGTDSVKGWVLGTLGAGFYLGNIYGSAICADLYNRRVHDEFIRGLQIEITLP